MFWKLLFCVTKSSSLIVSNISIRYFVNRTTLSIGLYQRVCCTFVANRRVFVHFTSSANNIPRLSLDHFFKKGRVLALVSVRSMLPCVLLECARPHGVKLCCSACTTHLTQVSCLFISRDRHISPVCYGSLVYLNLSSQDTCKEIRCQGEVKVYADKNEYSYIGNQMLNKLLYVLVCSLDLLIIVFNEFFDGRHVCKTHVVQEIFWMDYIFSLF